MAAQIAETFAPTGFFTILKSKISITAPERVNLQRRIPSQGDKRHHMLIIGIAGGTGCGKTTVVNQIMNELFQLGQVGD